MLQQATRTRARSLAQVLAEGKLSVKWFGIGVLVVISCVLTLQQLWFETKTPTTDDRTPIVTLPTVDKVAEWCETTWQAFDYSQHDVVLPIDEPNCITRTIIANLLRFYNFRRLIFIINDVAHCPALLDVADDIGVRDRLECHDRDTIIPGMTLASLQDLPADKRGWIFQQLVKFGATSRFADLSPLFLVWDSDLIPLKPVPLFSHLSNLNQPRATFFAGHQQSHNPKARATYHHMYEVLTGGLRLIDPPGGSWIYGWQVWYRPYVRELLDHFATTAGRDSSEWARVIVDTIVREAGLYDFNLRNSFSEFDSYGSWVWMKHPLHIDFWHRSDTLWIRYPEELKAGECCPSSATLCALTEKYVYVPWENHKFNDLCSPQTIHNTRHVL